MITLKTLANAAPQEVFDQVVAHARKQGEKSILSGVCQYWNYDNETKKVSRCFAGCFFSNDEYSTSFEQRMWASLVDDGIAPRAHQKLISDLQTIHDDCDVSNWESEFEWLAKHEGLYYEAK